MGYLLAEKARVAAITAIMLVTFACTGVGTASPAANTQAAPTTGPSPTLESARYHILATLGDIDSCLTKVKADLDTYSMIKSTTGVVDDSMRQTLFQDEDACRAIEAPEQTWLASRPDIPRFMSDAYGNFLAHSIQGIDNGKTYTSDAASLLFLMTSMTNPVLQKTVGDLRSLAEQLP